MNEPPILTACPSVLSPQHGGVCVGPVAEGLLHVVPGACREPIRHPNRCDESSEEGCAGEGEDHVRPHVIVHLPVGERRTIAERPL